MRDLGDLCEDFGFSVAGEFLRFQRGRKGLTSALPGAHAPAAEGGQEPEAAWEVTAVTPASVDGADAGGKAFARTYFPGRPSGPLDGPALDRYGKRELRMTAGGPR